MMATEIDSLWFHGHPDRQFRLRRQTPAEIAQWPVQPRPDCAAWCIICRETGQLQAFALKAGETWGDDDIELAPFFAELGGLA